MRCACGTCGKVMHACMHMCMHALCVESANAGRVRGGRTGAWARQRDIGKEETRITVRTGQCLPVTVGTCAIFSKRTYCSCTIAPRHTLAPVRSAPPAPVRRHPRAGASPLAPLGLALHPLTVTLPAPSAPRCGRALCGRTTHRLHSPPSPDGPTTHTHSPHVRRNQASDQRYPRCMQIRRAPLRPGTSAGLREPRAPRR